MSLYAQCDNCGYLNDRYINEPTTVAKILDLLEKEHRERSPDCPTKTMELLVAVHDPLSSDRVPGTTTRMVRLIHVARERAKPEPFRE